MAELRFAVTVRRQGEKPHTGELFKTEDFDMLEDLKLAICHLVDVEAEQEAEFDGDE